MHEGPIPTQEYRSEESFETLINRLESLWEQYHIHGHGTWSGGDAEQIVREGLHTTWRALQDFTHPLPQDPERIKALLHAWPYEAQQHIVLVAVPKNTEYYASDAAGDGRNGWDNRERSAKYANVYVFDDMETNTTQTSQHKKRIPPGRIIGYWDDDAKNFHPNPMFTTTVDAGAAQI